MFRVAPAAAAPLTVHARAGRDPLSEDLALAVLDLAKHLYRPQRLSPVSGRPGMANESERAVRGFLLPLSVASAIRLHLRYSDP